MRTPEEIIKDKKQNVSFSATNPQYIVSEKDCIEAMTDYAKQEAEAFAEWIVEKYFAYNSTEGMWYATEANSKPMTTKELFELFKTEKKDGK